MITLINCILDAQMARAMKESLFTLQIAELYIEIILR